MNSGRYFRKVSFFTIALMLASSLPSIGAEGAAIPAAGPVDKATSPVKVPDFGELGIPKAAVNLSEPTQAYTPTVKKAGEEMGEELILLPWGRGPGQAAGPEEDLQRYTDGFPPAFCFDSSGEILILDAAQFRILAVDKNKKTTVRVSYPPTLVCNDLAVLPDGRIALNDQSSSSVVIVGPDGRETERIEGVMAAEVVVNSDGNLEVPSLKSGTYMIFSPACELIAELSIEGELARPVANSSGRIVKIDMHEGKATIRTYNQKGETLSEVLLPDPEKDWYVPHARPLGFDSAGKLIVERVCSHDIDEKRERHVYRSEILRVDPTSGTIEAKVITPMFREWPSSIPPRFYQVGPDGGVYTFFHYIDRGYAVHRIDPSKFNGK